jgi:hypothetical protein
LGGKKTYSSKPNQNAKCPQCRKKWDVNRFGRICEEKLNGVSVKNYRDPDKKLWWSAETEGHGGSTWEIMDQEGNDLVHECDADIYGDCMGEHKGETGKSISMDNMKCRDRKGGRQ